ncbi:MAG: Rrf2 family transcriptional regulator [Ignavibacteriae bacterium]|nr:Rrf2 family transcriptional regulator [Ignavibacteriota bacterium]
MPEEMVRTDKNNGEGNADNAELTVRIAELEANNAELQNHIAELTSHNAELDERIAELTKHNAELNKRNAELNSHNAELDKHNAELTKHIAELNEHNAVLESRIAELQKQIAELHGRKSSQKLKNEPEKHEKRNPERTVTPQTAQTRRFVQEKMLGDDVLRSMGLKIAFDLRREQIMLLLQKLYENDMATLKQLMELTGLPEDTCVRLIRRLTAKGWMRRIGGQKMGGYRLTDEGRNLFGE